MVTTTTLIRMGAPGAVLCACENPAQKTNSRNTTTKRSTSFGMCSPTKQFGELPTHFSENANLYHSEPPTPHDFAHTHGKIICRSRRISCALAHQPVWYAMHAPANPGETRNQPLTALAPQEDAAAAAYGLRRGALSPLETLAQSVSTIAPTTTPAATIPLVCALAGNGTWLAYLLATAAVLLVALCIAKYARYSSSPGSLYTYAHTVLPPWLAAVAAWSLLLAYVGTGSSVIAGFFHYANLLVHDLTGHFTSGALLALLVTAISMVIAWRDIKISARLMLWIEAISVAIILFVVVLVLFRHGPHLDSEQLHR